MKRFVPPFAPLLLTFTLGGLACGEEGGNPDAGGGDGGDQNCGPLPAAEIRCTDPSCNATTGTKTFGQASLKSSDAKDWVVVSWATSEVAAANENTEVSYQRATSNGLTPRAQDLERRARLSPEVYGLVYSPERVARLAAEHRIRAIENRHPAKIGVRQGTAIRARDILPVGVKKQAMACTDANPSTCGASMLCVIPEGMTGGECASTLTIKFYGTGPNAENVNATVRKVGQKVAIVVDDANNAAVSDGDVSELVKRFDEHIAPRDHQLFGEPTVNGKDRDGNGVVTIFLTSRVGQISSSLVGFFFGDDMLSTAERPYSNAADILYMQPPGGSVTLDALSGTIGHEYEHIISYTAKVLKNQSDREEVWLDEGLATFAEDVLGYGRDSFTNVLAYLGAVGDTSLTGYGLVHSSEQEADGFERRGMAQLMVRYVFERAGGAAYPASGGGEITDSGGVAAVRRMVQGPATGIDALVAGGQGKTFEQWLGDLMTTVAVDGTKEARLACVGQYNFNAPATDPYTNFQRGLDLRTTVQVPGGQAIPLNGPQVSTLENEQVPFPINGGEVRSVAVASGTVDVSVGGPADGKIGFRAIPKP